MRRNPTYQPRPKPPPHVYPSAAYHHLGHSATQHAYRNYRPRSQPTPLPSPPPHTLQRPASQPLPSIHSLTQAPPPISSRQRPAELGTHSRKSSDLGRFSFTHRDISRRREASPVRHNPYRSPPPTEQLHPLVKQEPRDYFNHRPSERSSVHHHYSCKHEDDWPLTPLSALLQSPAMTPDEYQWPHVEGDTETQTQPAPGDGKPDATADTTLDDVRSSAENAVAAAAAEAVATAAVASSNQDVVMAAAPEIRLPETLGSASHSPAMQADPKPQGNGHQDPYLSVPEEKKDTPFSRSPELRVSHKLAERKRRKEMRDLFDELREQLPADRGMKASKWEILSKAVDYIQNLKVQAVDAQRTIEMLHRDLALARGEAPGNPTPWTSSYHNFNLPYVSHAPPANANPPAAQQAAVAQPPAQPTPVVSQPATQTQPAQPAQPAATTPQVATQPTATPTPAPAQTQEHEVPAEPAAEAVKADS